MSAQGVRNLQGQRRRKEKGGGKRRQRCVLQKELPSTFTRVYFISVACASGVTSTTSSCSSGSYAFVLPFLSRRGRKLARRVHTHPRQKSYVLYMRPLTKRINNNFWCAKEKSLIDFTLIFSASLSLFLSLLSISLPLFVQSFYFDFMTPNVFESSKKNGGKTRTISIITHDRRMFLFSLLCCRHLALCICKHIHEFYRWRHLRTKKGRERGREITVVCKEFPSNVKSLEKMLEMAQPQRKLI